MKKANVVGLMSGTSLDGLDICFVAFEIIEGRWNINQLITKDYPYTEEWRNKLRNAFHASPNELDQLNVEFGLYQARYTNAFIQEKGLAGKVDFVAAHGHTIFHKPSERYTLQIGDGAAMAEEIGLPVINDFRSLDVQLGGQGAPLVPVGDALLFGEYEACLNLGGFSNISFELKNERKAFDIGPCNLPLNQICRDFFNVEYDRGGELAKKGNCISNLYDELNNLSFYSSPIPKSLGFEWLTSAFDPILKRYENETPEDVLRTVVGHEAYQVACVLNDYAIKNVLVTGGGAFNHFLINCIREKTKAKLVLPDTEIIGFKEAIIFAFLGLLRYTNQINTYKSVTGARRDSIGGVLHF